MHYAVAEIVQLLEPVEALQSEEGDLVDLRFDLPLHHGISHARIRRHVRVRAVQRVLGGLGPGLPGIEDDLHRTSRLERRAEGEGGEYRRSAEIVLPAPTRSDEVASAEDDRVVRPLSAERHPHLRLPEGVELLLLEHRLERAREEAAHLLHEAPDGAAWIRIPRAAREPDLLRSRVDVRLPREIRRLRVEEEPRLLEGDGGGRAQVGESRPHFLIDLRRPLPHGGFEERVPRRLARLDLQDQHVGERARPVKDEDQYGDEDGRLDQRRPLFFAKRAHQCRRNCLTRELSKSFGTRFAALDSVIGMSRAPQSGLKKFGVSRQSPGRW